MMRPLPLAACLALAATLPMATLTAQTPAPAAPVPTTHATDAASAAARPITGNADKGRTLTYTCQGCHGITGYKNAYPNYHVPRIGGQSSDYLINALTEYQKGNRKHPTMQAQSESFSDQDIADIAAFLSTVK